MKFMRNKAGFTLVELIVVIAILAILAGVAIPVYSGYIKKANETADLTALETVKTAVDAAYATASTKPTHIKVEDKAADAITVSSDGTNYSAMTGTTLSDFNQFYTGASNGSFSIVLKSGSTAVWNGTKWTITGTAYTPS